MILTSMLISSRAAL